MVAKNNLFILFQNQLVEYIHKIQDKILPQQYDSLKEYYTTFKESNYKIRNFVGYYKLSRVVFLRNNEALVEIIKKYAGTDGGLYWLKKSNGKWEVKKRILIDYRIRNENF